MRQDAAWFLPVHERRVEPHSSLGANACSWSMILRDPDGGLVNLFTPVTSEAKAKYAR